MWSPRAHPTEPADSLVGELLLRLALDLVSEFAAGRTPAVEDLLAPARAEYLREALAPSTAAVAAAARERDIPVERIGTLGLLRLGYGRHRRLVRAAMTDGTSAVGVDATNDRELTRQLLADLGLPIPPGGTVASADQAVDLFVALGPPVMVGPASARRAALRSPACEPPSRYGWRTPKRPDPGARWWWSVSRPGSTTTDPSWPGGWSAPSSGGPPAPPSGGWSAPLSGGPATCSPTRPPAPGGT